MRSSSLRRLFVVGGSLLSAALGQFCTPDNLEAGSAYIVHDQAALDAIASCKFLNANIIMSANYTGRFYLPNVRHIDGDLRWRADLQLNGPHEPVPTSIELPDLETVRGEPSFDNLLSIRKVSMPKLRVSPSLHLQASEEVDLRSLEEAGSIYVTGDMSSLRLDALKKVNTTLYICNKKDCTWESPTTSGLDLSLPSLERVGSMKLDGRISTLKVPQLSNSTGGFELETSGGEPLDISMPQLAYVWNIKVVGEIKSLSIPKVKEIESTFHLETSEELFLKTNIEQAYEIYLSGNLTGVEFDHLKSVDGFIIKPTVPFDCDALEESLGTAIDNMTYPYYCKASKPGLSTGAKIGIGVGIGGAGAIVIILGTWFWLRRTKRKASLTTKPTSAVPLDEMPPTYGEATNQDQPPEYASSGSR